MGAKRGGSAAINPHLSDSAPPKSGLIRSDGGGTERRVGLEQKLEAKNKKPKQAKKKENPAEI